ncbi:hypothetical protein EON80_18580 [bacterium]|nr:MAG: hypothetical protein EON80_18580 [bacterium]
MNTPTKFIEDLEVGQSKTLLVYGTSLSFHLAPLLRTALRSRYEDRVTVINSGMSATASRTGMQELEKKVLQHQFDALLLEFAVNDAYNYEDYPDDSLDKGISLSESRENLEYIIEHVQKAWPDCEIILQTMNPTYDAANSEAFAGSRRPDLDRYYDVYRSVARERNLLLIDNTAMWNVIALGEPERFQELIPDGAHPTPAAIRSLLVPHLLSELGIEHSDPNVF